MKKALCIVLVLFLAVMMAGCSSAPANDADNTANASATKTPADPNKPFAGTEIVVFNWFDYIDPTVIDLFTAETGITVKYANFTNNEEMYTKLVANPGVYDIIVPSDYIIERLIKDDGLEKLDLAAMPNVANLSDWVKNPSYDPSGEYSVPYMWGTVGILYNTKYVDAEDVTGWELLWNEKYAGKILTFGNSRDAFGVAQYLLGYDVNTTDKEELLHCAQLLKEQKPVLQQYVMDEIFAIMQNEEAWIAPYYAGDCLTMMGENENLDFYLPENQGFNLFTDAMCIPTCAKEKEAAELFINFLCDPEIAGANMDWICYGTPLSAAKEFIDPETVADPVTYPDPEILKNGSSYAYLPEDISRYVEGLFMEVRNG